MSVAVSDVAPGLWIWRTEHPGWREGVDWQPLVTSVCVEAGGERWLIDPLLPPDDERAFWDRLADRPPTAVAIIIPDPPRDGGRSHDVEHRCDRGALRRARVRTAVVGC